MAHFTPRTMHRIAHFTPRIMPRIVHFTPRIMPRIAHFTPRIMPRIAHFTPHACMPCIARFTPHACLASRTSRLPSRGSHLVSCLASRLTPRIVPCIEHFTPRTAWLTPCITPLIARLAHGAQVPFYVNMHPRAKENMKHIYLANETVKFLTIPLLRTINDSSSDDDDSDDDSDNDSKSASF